MIPYSFGATAPFDLTQFEIQGLASANNFADARPHQRPSAAEEPIVRDLYNVWDHSQDVSQAVIEEGFVRTFFGFHGQHSLAAEPDRSNLSYSASIAMMVVATFLRLRRASVTLIEPCFDNLSELLNQNEVSLRPIDETAIFDSPDVAAALRAGNVGDALVIVDPNNPTGSTSFTDHAQRFREIVRYCRDHGKVLVLDFSFASFLNSGAGRPDVYSLLDASGVTYLAIEDTGKTWPTHDLKAGVLTVSRNIEQEVRNLHTGVLLNVSPFALELITRFIGASTADGFRSVSLLLARNRATLVRALSGSKLEHLRPTAGVSVAWCRLREGTATDLQAELATSGVHVLPGTHFYWSDRSRGESFVRVALAREPERFERSADLLRRALLRS